VKFGLEAEKFIFNMKSRRPSQSVFSLIDALSDFDRMHGHGFGVSKPTNEFVLNMVEFGTTPSSDPLKVLKDYYYNYLMIREVAAREQVSLVPLASLPMDYLPHMTPKRAYYIQYSILSGELQSDWLMDASSPLKSAGNCAGIHVHAELETPREFLYSNDELKDKFNLGLMLTPMIAFASSPYFYGQHAGRSMRGLKYYGELYKKFPLNGQLPPVMNSSVEVLEFMRQSGLHWIGKGMDLGFSEEEMGRLVWPKSANWNPIRWNSRWNTIEIRCLDSDSIELDAAKFIWMCSTMRQTDRAGAGLKGRVLKSKTLDHGLIREALKVSGKEVSLLPTEAIRELFHRAMLSGTKDDLVEAYLHELSAFSERGLQKGEQWFFRKLLNTLEQHNTTAEKILKLTGSKPSLTKEEASDIVFNFTQGHESIVESFKSRAPDVLALFQDFTEGHQHV
jgi:hypothetical protein